MVRHVARSATAVALKRRKANQVRLGPQADGHARRETAWPSSALVPLELVPPSKGGANAPAAILASSQAVEARMARMRCAQGVQVVARRP